MHSLTVQCKVSSGVSRRASSLLLIGPGPWLCRFPDSLGSRLAQDGQHLEPDPAEQAALAEIRRLRSQGSTLRGIATALDTSYLPVGTFRRSSSKKFSRKMMWFCAFWASGASAGMSAAMRLPSGATS